MKRTVACIIILCCMFQYLPGSSARGQPSNTVYVKAPVSIGNIGIQNLVVGISYDAVSDDSSFLESPGFLSFMSGVRVELQDIAMQEILAHPYLTLDTMSELTGSIQTKTTEMIESRLQSSFPDRQITIPVAISTVEFYNTDRATLYIESDDPR